MLLGDRLGFGDEIMAAGEAQRIYEQGGQKVAITDRSGAVRWSDIWRGNPAIASVEESRLGGVQRIRNGPNARPYNANMPFTAKSGVKFTDWRARDHRGRIYLTEDEIAIGRSVRERLGPYWVVEPSPSARSNPNKRWPFERFQALVGQVVAWRWVQPLHKESQPLDAVRSVSTATFRDACGLLASAEGYVGTEGGLHHAAASLGIPAVVIFGGCMSVETFGYPEHVNLADDGPESPCGRWLLCAHCTQAMDRISVDQVLAACIVIGTPSRRWGPCPGMPGS